jgi:RNA polymerase sigma-70 factor (ECF subfamily)
MVTETADSLPTRPTLLNRLKDLDDQESWREFFGIYWRLIYNTALKAGLSETEAEDVVQETLAGMARQMPTFCYDPRRGSFKIWLLRQTSWRIVDKFRKRRAHPSFAHRRAVDSKRTSTIDQIPDPNGFDPAAIWDQEWETGLLDAAIERVKSRVDPKQFQMFDLYVLQKWPVKKIARLLQVNAGRVYLAKHRVAGLIRKEHARLKKRPPWPAKHTADAGRAGAGAELLP